MAPPASPVPPVPPPSDWASGGSGAGAESGGAPSAEQLQKGLGDLERAVQGQIAYEISIRNSNMSFAANETTQLLIAACEKLALEKEAMDRAHFEEHTSELPFMCRHFNTSVDAGLSEKVYREKLAAASPQKGAAKPKRRRRVFGLLCCQVEFPPQQAWWLDITRSLRQNFQVLRAGKIVIASALELVQGDVMYLQAGQRAAADGRVLVHTEGTAIDVSQLSDGLQDVRLCSTEATAGPITTSSNIVLKDSYLVQGALFMMVVRTPVDPFIPLPLSSQPEEEHEFLIDMAVPPGMSASACRSLFKTLCVKARLPCRSFFTIARLATVKALVVLLTQDILEKGTVSQLATSIRRLNKRLFLVDCGCQREALDALAKEFQFEVVNFVEEGLRDELSDRGSSMVPGIDVESPANSVRGLATLKVDNPAETSRLQSLVEASPSGAVLRGISQGGLTTLCGLLKDAGMTTLYAMGGFWFPGCFKAVTTQRLNRVSQRWWDNDNCMAPKASMERVSHNTSARRSQADPPPVPPKQEAPTNLSNTSTDLTSRSPGSKDSGGRGSPPRTRSPFEGTTPDKNDVTDPSTGLDLTGISHAPRNRKLIDLMVSVNSIGIVSEVADCVLLKSDLGYLGQALEIASKGVPQDIDLQAQESDG